MAAAATLALAVCSCTRDPHGPAFLQHSIIDPAPDSGADCCSDVLIIADINGDRALDVVVGSEGAAGAGLVWYKFPTWEKHPIAMGQFTTDGTAADMDGDGDVDIVIGTLNETPGALVWYENPGGTGPASWLPHHIGTGYVHDVALGDLDGDGDLDVATCDKQGVIVWRNRGEDHFERQQVTDAPGEGIAIADINNDTHPDIVFGAHWLENPGHRSPVEWRSHAIAGDWPKDTRVVVASMNDDDRPDVVLSASEGTGRLSWFESPRDLATSPWVEHVIDSARLEGTHSLQVGDFDLDGGPDVVAAEMHTASKKRVRLYLNRGTTFEPIDLSRRGSHNMRAADIDRDGDVDLVGKNYAGRHRAVEMWENRSAPAGNWTYRSIDAARPKHEQGKMGLAFLDVDSDGYVDVVAGSQLYLNPKGDLTAPWTRVALGADLDVLAAVPSPESDGRLLLATTPNDLVLLSTRGTTSGQWDKRVIAPLPTGRTQGVALGHLLPDRPPQLVFPRGTRLLCAQIPPAGLESASWQVVALSDETQEEGVAIGDIDRDGRPDIAAVGSDGAGAVWLCNPGSITDRWQAIRIGDVKPWTDRIGLADLNGDGCLDLVATAERQDWERSAELVWFECPQDPHHDIWPRHVVARHRSLNSLDLVDFDRNGTTDLVVAEHSDLTGRQGAPDNLTVVYLNGNHGVTWEPWVIERGPHSSHLGGRCVDLNNDGMPEIVSIAWSQYQTLHLWARSAQSPPADPRR